MASPLARSACRVLRPLTNNKRILTVPAVRTAAYWNKDWKPGPYPQTEEERIAAAKRYALRPEDYKTYEDDGFGYGDYPDLGKVGQEARDPYEVYDLPEQKRNYGEPIPVNADLWAEHIYNPQARFRYSEKFMASMLCGVVGSLVVLYVWFDDYKAIHPIKPKQYPRDGKHYIFEPVD